MHRFVLVLLFVSTSSVFSSEQESVTSGLSQRASELATTLDLVLAAVTSRFDPLPLRDQDFEFTRRLTFFTLRAEATLINGQLTGLSNLRRESIDAQSNNSVIVLDADFSLDNLVASYDAELKVAGITKTGSIEARGTDIHLNVVLALSSNGIELQSLMIEDSVDIDVTIRDLGFFGWLLRLLDDRVEELLEEELKNYVNNRLRDELQSKLDQINNSNSL